MSEITKIKTNIGDSTQEIIAKKLYNLFLSRCTDLLGEVQHGEFGADMQVELVNDGPFTIYLESEIK